tara:strand:+ start:9900 stop:10106 length:207 start_codon:yes stop_codon:yes gene_type:complete
MSEHLACILDDENFFLCCRCGVKTDFTKNDMYLDDVHFGWDCDTDEEYDAIFKEGEFQIHRDCKEWAK